MRNLFFLSYLFLLTVISCERPDISPIEEVMRSSHPAILAVAHNPKAYEVQIIYSEINTNELGETSFRDHTFRLNDSAYFYPASTVKLPAALLAMEFADQHPGITATNNYSYRNDSVNYRIANDIQQIFAVSDNESYNRLYDLLGRDYINQALSQKGIGPVRIAHRLATSNSGKPLRDSILFSSKRDTVFYLFGKDSLISNLAIKKQQKGKGYIQNDSLIEQPMDFSEKNYFPLRAQHELMKRFFFPENFSEEERFKHSEENRNLILEAMHTVPRKAGFDEKEYYDSYGKFFVYGDSKERIPDAIKIYNKVGYAYGTLTETALITHEAKNIQYLLSATILVNKNGVFNDDHYEYDEVGIPFLAQLGRELYLYETIRDRD